MSLETPRSGPACDFAGDFAGDFMPCEFRVKWADCRWEQAHAAALRRAVFCREQGLFGANDRDAIDDHAQVLVALSCVAGTPDEVVGTVRIHQERPREWWGSRLAVAAAFRSFGRIGATLIRLAVSSANTLGCDAFFAHVQRQNVPLFERLHWDSIREVQLHGRPHQLMRADLGHYPPCSTPYAGFVTRTAPAQPRSAL